MAINYLIDNQVSDYIIGTSGTVSIGSDKLISTNTNGIEGLPYQFMPTVDRRLSGYNVGRKYAEKIYSHLPLLFLTPCKPSFMDDFNKQDTEQIASSLVNLIGGNSSGVSTILTGDTVGRYYTVEFDADTYYNYLNLMLQSIARYIFNDEDIRLSDNVSIKNYHWENEANGEIEAYFSNDSTADLMAKNNIIYYLDQFTSVDESFSNSTTESSLASTINQYSTTANEIRFLFGKEGSVAASLLEAGSEITENIGASLSSVASSLAGGIIGSLSNKGVSSVLNGGKIIFPKIWGDSSYDKSYSFNIKLRSPDHDNLSIFLNVIKPYCKILALTMPKAISDDDPNSYGSPFLVRAGVKGMVSIDMGMITSLSVTKGADCCWNDSGLPTQIDISITIEDLYPRLMMNTGDSLVGTINNTAYMDFLLLNSGILTSKQEIGRRAEYFVNVLQSEAHNYLNNKVNKLENFISNKIATLYGYI